MLRKKITPTKTKYKDLFPSIFAHFCKMFVGVRPSVRLFRRFHVLRPVNRQPPRLSGYYFQHQTKGSSKYIAALSPGRWERWREDWVLV
jgi:hypothetical protein